MLSYIRYNHRIAVSELIEYFDDLAHGHDTGGRIEFILNDLFNFFFLKLTKCLYPILVFPFVDELSKHGKDQFTISQYRIGGGYVLVNFIRIAGLMDAHYVLCIC